MFAPQTETTHTQNKETTESYTRITPSQFVLTHHPEFNISSISDDIECTVEGNSAQNYRTSDVQFIKFLDRTGVLIKDENGVYYCPGFKKRGENLSGKEVLFYKIIKALEDAYVFDEYKDADLEDDVYDHENIVKPSDIYTCNTDEKTSKKSKISSEALMEAHRKKWDLEFKTPEDRNKYYISRSKLYCQYVFLRRLAILYRETPLKEPLIKFFEFYDRYSSLKKAAFDLRVDALTHEDHNWSTGLHEWLMCASFREALNRTGGLVKGIEPNLPALQAYLPHRADDSINNTIYWSEFNWLDYQYLIRTKYERIIFRDTLEGHTGSVNREDQPSNRKAGWLTTFKSIPTESGFDATLLAIFQQVSTPMTLILETYKFYYSKILHDQTQEYGEHAKRFGFTATGKSTQSKTELDEFRSITLKKAHDEFKVWLRDLWMQSQILSIKENDTITLHYQANHILPIELEAELHLEEIPDSSQHNPGEMSASEGNLGMKK